MAARLNDPELRRQIVRLKAAGLGIGRGARVLGIAQSTWTWHLKRAQHEVMETRAAKPLVHLTPAVAPYRVDAQGERVSTPPGVVRYRCEACEGQSTDPLGHPSCRAVAA